MFGFPSAPLFGIYEIKYMVCYTAYRTGGLFNNTVYYIAFKARRFSNQIVYHTAYRAKALQITKSQLVVDTFLNAIDHQPAPTPASFTSLSNVEKIKLNPANTLHLTSITQWTPGFVVCLSSIS